MLGRPRQRELPRRLDLGTIGAHRFEKARALGQKIDLRRILRGEDLLVQMSNHRRERRTPVLPASEQRVRRRGRRIELQDLLGVHAGARLVAQKLVRGGDFQMDTREGHAIVFAFERPLRAAWSSSRSGPGAKAGGAASARRDVVAGAGGGCETDTFGGCGDVNDAIDGMRLGLRLAPAASTGAPLPCACGGSGGGALLGRVEAPPPAAPPAAPPTAPPAAPPTAAAGRGGGGLLGVDAA